MGSLEGKIVIITGASSGIGLAAAIAFAKQKTKLMLAARRENKLIAACEEIKKLGAEAEYMLVDVAKESDVKKLIEKTLQRYNRIDILVNNSGYGHFFPLAQTTSQQMHDIMEVNFFGTFYASHEVLPIMIKQQSGHIINISSVAGKRVFRQTGGAYNITKFAMQGFTEALRMELINTPIRVTSICPVTTVTEFFDLAKEQTGKSAKILGPAQTAEHVANAIIKVAINPKAEVVLVGALRIVFALQALFPGLVDKLIYRFVGSKKDE